MIDPSPTLHEADVVVVGAGVAGLTVVLGLANLRVALLTKGAAGRSGSTPLAQGGIAAAVAPGDTPDLHAADTLAAAAGLADPRAVHVLTHEASEAVRRTLSFGVHLDRDPDGSLSVHREAAHARGRVVHARDATGKELARGLTAALAGQPHLTIFENTFAANLLVRANRVCGVAARDEEGRPHLFAARAVVLATGGIGRLWARTTNPAEATGDGLAMAARAGAHITDLEFVQFHPTALLSEMDPLPLLTEALRGAGAVIVDERQRRFLLEVDPAAELAPRDVVARGMAHHILSGHGVFLDARSIGPAFPERFPTVLDICQRAGLDPRLEPIPVTPAAHYHMGGVVVDELGRTSLSGLLACGEVACTGVHGANRLASNSLLEGLVFGHRLARALAVAVRDPMASVPRLRGNEIQPVDRDLPSGENAAAVEAIRSEMWTRVGLLRDAPGLARARKEIDRVRTALGPGSSEAHNMALVAGLVAAAAEARPESRGAHHRVDHPVANPAWHGRHITKHELATSESLTTTTETTGVPR